MTYTVGVVFKTIYIKMVSPSAICVMDSSGKPAMYVTGVSFKTNISRDLLGRPKFNGAK